MLKPFFSLTVLFFTFLCAPLNAQTTVTPFNDRLLDISQRNKPAAGLYTGAPFVKIEPTVGAPVTEKLSGWMDDEKKRLFGTTQITKNQLFNQSISEAPAPIQNTPEIQYTSPTGSTLSALYIPHTSDFISIIQVVDNKTLSVEEIIQTINPNRSLFSRTIPLDTRTVSTPNSFKLIRAERNGQPFELQVAQEGNQIKLTHPAYLDAGVQSYYLKYIIRDGISVRDGKGVLNYAVTGFDWPLPVDRFTVIVSFPNKVSSQIKEVVFGSNEVAIQNAFSAETDSNGNTIYRLNNPLPAFANVKIYQTFQGKILSDNSIERFLNDYISWIIVFLMIGAIILYLVVSAFYLRFKKPEPKTIQFIHHFSPIALAYLYTGRVTPSFLESQKEFYSYISNKNKEKLYKSLKKFLNSKIFKYTFYSVLYLRLSFKYWITAFIMPFGMIYLARLQNIYLTSVQYAVTLFISILCIILFFRFWGKNDLIKEVKQYRIKLINQNTFYGLSRQSILNLFVRHYPRLSAINSQNEWIDLASSYDAAIKQLPFIYQQGEANEKHL